jgi:hypothetical protein
MWGETRGSSRLHRSKPVILAGRCGDRLAPNPNPSIAGWRRHQFRTSRKSQVRSPSDVTTMVVTLSVTLEESRRALSDSDQA